MTTVSTRLAKLGERSLFMTGVGAEEKMVG